MIAALKLVPTWAWIAGAAIVVLGWQELRIGDAHVALSRAQSALAGEQRDRKDERARLLQAGLDAVDKARGEEQRRIAAQQEVIRDAEKALSLARGDAARADDAAGRLRRHAAALAARGDRPAGDSGAAAGGPTAEAPGTVLAELLERAESRAGILAAYADESRIAGRACEAAYESLTFTPGPAAVGSE